MFGECNSLYESHNTSNHSHATTASKLQRCVGHTISRGEKKHACFRDHPFMMGAPDDNKGRPSLLGSSTPAADASSATAPNAESTRVLAQLGGRESGAKSFFKRPSVWASLALLIGVAGAATYQLQSKRTDASVNVATAAPVKPAPAAEASPVARPAPETPALASATTPAAAPEPTTARIVEGDTSSPSQQQQQQQQSTPFAAIGAQPMVVPPSGKSARAAATANPPRAEKTTMAAAAAKKPTQVASSKQPARAANGKPVKTAANTSKTPKRANNNAAQTASRSSKPDPDTDLLTALLRRSKAPDPAPQPSALAEVAADCKSGQRCKP
ncbi:hypothetical protein J2W28_005180 [Variovorax boronicumulans]|uniref:hypothetical protein n=1 Tax=Variovorax boronicumulans TaxID=436515 RepID=UPI0027813AF3|nr:hypothetical protein [Variovorax boronicumulans]MDP9994647.1 hypothetical protein [Variovorax boronicumulans]MDQ0006011.1 hypothetical protein [Variovorax boronicumulans]